MLLNGQPRKAQTANIQREIGGHCFLMNNIERLNKWTAFVRRHRPKVAPQQFSVLCLMHFTYSVFIVNAEVAKLLLEI